MISIRNVFCPKATFFLATQGRRHKEAEGRGIKPANITLALWNITIETRRDSPIYICTHLHRKAVFGGASSSILRFPKVGSIHVHSQLLEPQSVIKRIVHESWSLSLQDSLNISQSMFSVCWIKTQ